LNYEIRKRIISFFTMNIEIVTGYML